MECGRERTSAGERKAAGERFLKGREQIDVECRFSTQVSEGKALENINRTLQRAKGQIVFKKTNRRGLKIIFIFIKIISGRECAFLENLDLTFGSLLDSLRCRAGSLLIGSTQ